MGRVEPRLPDVGSADVDRSLASITPTGECRTDFY
jgi:hypothetical protein